MAPILSHKILSASIRSEPGTSRHISSRLMLLGSPPDMVHRLPLRETGTSTRMPAEGISWRWLYYTRLRDGLQEEIFAGRQFPGTGGRIIVVNAVEKWYNIPAVWNSVLLNRKEVNMLDEVISFIVSVIASVIAHYICKRLDSHGPRR